MDRAGRHDAVLSHPPGLLSSRLKRVQDTLERRARPPCGLRGQFSQSVSPPLTESEHAEARFGGYLKQHQVTSSLPRPHQPFVVGDAAPLSRQASGVAFSVVGGTSQFQ